MYDIQTTPSAFQPVRRLRSASAGRLRLEEGLALFLSIGVSFVAVLLAALKPQARAEAQRGDAEGGLR